MFKVVSTTIFSQIQGVKLGRHGELSYDYNPSYDYDLRLWLWLWLFNPLELSNARDITNELQ